ncbi:hypothetical protein K440DRAFT_644039 [Wilcoxina mikolae CBS 423.85]|nr:hypothetical protein K440DRAFT_644039 [Wilcoxina mikolae CBS 423.85]
MEGQETWLKWLKRSPDNYTWQMKSVSWSNETTLNAVVRERETDPGPPVLGSNFIQNHRKRRELMNRPVGPSDGFLKKIHLPHGSGGMSRSGLDECDKEAEDNARTNFLQRMTNMVRDPSKPVKKLLVTTRPIPNILDQLEGFPHFDLTAHSEDLKIFVDERVSTLPNRFSSHLRSKAAQLLLERAGRTFLWASIVVKELGHLQLPSVAELERTIIESSTDVNVLYSDIFNQILNGGDAMKKLVMWVIYGRRPLTLKELEAALATQFDSDSEEATRDYRVELTPETLVTIVGIFLESTDSGVVHFIHQSARGFVIENNLFTYQGEADYLSEALIRIIQPHSSKLDIWAEQAGVSAESIRQHLLKVTTAVNIEWLASYLLNDEHTHIAIMPDDRQYALSSGSPAIAKAVLASSRDGDKRALELVVGNRNTDWTVIREGFHGTLNVTVEVVESAAENWVNGNLLMEKIAASGNVEFAEGAFERIVRLFSADMVQSLLKRVSGVSITKDIIKAASTNERGGSSLIRALLEPLKILEVDAEIIGAAVRSSLRGKEIIGAFADSVALRGLGSEVIRLLLGRKVFAVTEGMLIAAIEAEQNDILELFLAKDAEIITEAVLVAVMGGPWCYPDFFDLLFDRDPDIEITEAVLVAGVRGWSEHDSDGGSLKKLLVRAPNVRITETVLLEALALSYKRKVVIELILDGTFNIDITEKVLVAAGHVSIGSCYQPTELKTLMDMLLDRAPDIEITETLLMSIATVPRQEVIEPLLARNPNIHITGKILEAFGRNCNSRASKELGGSLLARCPNIEITEALLIAAANWSGAGEWMELLLTRDPNIKITNVILLAAGENGDCEKQVKGLLLARCPNIEITEALLVTATGWYGAGEWMEVFLSRDLNIVITEAVLIAALGSSGGGEIMEALLSKDHNVESTEAVIHKAAALDPYRGAKIMELLLAKNPQIVITEEVLLAAEEHRIGDEMMEVLLARDHNVEITEAVILKVVAGKFIYGVRTLELVLVKNLNIFITEEVLLAAVENKLYGAEITGVLLERDPNIEITEAVLLKLVVAVGTHYGVKMMEVMLAKNSHIGITEAVLLAMMENKEEKKKWVESDFMKKLLGAPNIEITESVLAAAAKNDWISYHSKKQL